MTEHKDSRRRPSGRYLIVMLEPVVSHAPISVSLPAGSQVLFISDVHLGYGTREQDIERENRLLEVLQGAMQTCAHLFIVGDLFDLWFDYKRAIPRGHVRTLACLRAYRDAGIPVTYLMGNHDFGHHSFFRDELDIEVLGGDVIADIDGKRFYVAHGDGKAHNDTGYLILRSILRNSLAQWLYRLLHPNLGIGLASATSHGSREYTGQKDYGGSDGLRDFACARIDEGYDYVIMGHRHKAEEYHHNNGCYINLGHWLSRPCTYGMFDHEHGFILKSIS